VNFSTEAFFFGDYFSAASIGFFNNQFILQGLIAQILSQQPVSTGWAQCFLGWFNLMVA